MQEGIADAIRKLQNNPYCPQALRFVERERLALAEARTLMMAEAQRYMDETVSLPPLGSEDVSRQVNYRSLARNGNNEMEDIFGNSEQG